MGFKKRPVCRDPQIEIRKLFPESHDEGVTVTPCEGLAASEAHLVDAKPHSDAHKAYDFLVAQKLVVVQDGCVPQPPAVDAMQIAAIRDREAKVAHRAAE